MPFKQRSTALETALTGLRSRAKLRPRNESGTGGRVVEGTTLERWHTGNRIEGSNPSLSVTNAISYQLSVIREAPHTSGDSPSISDN